MVRAEPQIASKMKAALLHWFNTVGGRGCGGTIVSTMSDLWQEHVPALLLYLKTECRSLKGAKGSTALEVYEEALTFMMESTESKRMAGYLNAIEAAKGNELEISKFLLLFWYEICISDSETIEKSISFMEEVNLQDTMGDAIEWMNKSTENQDFNRWFHILFDSPCEEEENAEEAGDAKTPTNDRSMERAGEDVFICNTPSNIPGRHSMYAWNGLMVTPRLSARRQLPLPSNSEPRQFAVPHMPFSRGSPIAEQLNSPVMREKRREREMRTLQSKLTAALEERDLKEIEVKELKKQMNEEFESNHQLKSKFEDVKRDLVKENNLREQAESEVEGLRKEKNALNERLDQQCILVKKLRYESDLSLEDSNRLHGRIEELERQLNGKAREIVDLNDELESKRRMADDARNEMRRIEEQNENLKKELMERNEDMEEMTRDWKRRLEKTEEDRMEMESINHQSMGEMNAKLMMRDKELVSLKEEREAEKKKYDEERKKGEEEIRRVKEETEREKRSMIEEMREKKERLDELEREREKMDREKEEEIRDLRKKKSELEVEVMEAESVIISLKQKLAAAISNGDMMTQKVEELKVKGDASSRVIGQLKGSIEEMEKEREEREAELIRLRKVEETNEKMKEEIEKLMKEKEAAIEKAYNALLENDKFTALIESMKMEEEERRKEDEWHVTQLNADILTASTEIEKIKEEMRMKEKEREEEKMEREEEKKKEDEKMKEMMETMGEMEKEMKSLKFINKNQNKELVGMRRDIEWIEEMKKNNEEMKEKLERSGKDMETHLYNMEMVVSKKKELEMELEKKEKEIEKLKAGVTRMKERPVMNDLSSRNTADTSLSTLNRDRKGDYAPMSTLLDFDEEPTQLYSKSNLGSDNNGYVEVDDTRTPLGMRQMMEEEVDKENGTLYMMTPSIDRRQIPDVDTKKRLNTIASRNAQTLPHLRSTHAVENMSPNFSQEGLRDGVVRPPSTKKLSTIKRVFAKKN